VGSTPTLGSAQAWVGSSVAERLPVKERVVGSIPTLPSRTLALVERLGRQLGDQSSSEGDMLWVRVPPEPLVEMSSWSSPECSPSCHDGGRGFKSRRGR
jgi:hypothetical protein